MSPKLLSLLDSPEHTVRPQIQVKACPIQMIKADDTTIKDDWMDPSMSSQPKGLLGGGVW